MTKKKKDNTFADPTLGIDTETLRVRVRGAFADFPDPRVSSLKGILGKLFIK